MLGFFDCHIVACFKIVFLGVYACAFFMHAYAYLRPRNEDLGFFLISLVCFVLLLYLGLMSLVFTCLGLWLVE